MDLTLQLDTIACSGLKVSIQNEIRHCIRSRQNTYHRIHFWSETTVATQLQKLPRHFHSTVERQLFTRLETGLYYLNCAIVWHVLLNYTQLLLKQAVDSRIAWTVTSLYSKTYLPVAQWLARSNEIPLQPLWRGMSTIYDVATACIRSAYALLLFNNVLPLILRPGYLTSEMTIESIFLSTSSRLFVVLCRKLLTPLLDCSQRS